MSYPIRSIIRAIQSDQYSGWSNQINAQDDPKIQNNISNSLPFTAIRPRNLEPLGTYHAVLDFNQWENQAQQKRHWPALECRRKISGTSASAALGTASCAFELCNDSTNTETSRIQLHGFTHLTSVIFFLLKCQKAASPNLVRTILRSPVSFPLC